MSGTPINRGLTDDERSLLLRLAVDVVAGQLGCHPEAAADALDGMTVTLRGDARDVYLDANGRQIVHTTRDWLAWHATRDGIDPATDIGPIEPS